MNQIKGRQLLATWLSLIVILLPISLAATQNLIYDANGNLITGDGKYREYNSFNQLYRIRSGNTSSGRILEDYYYHPTEERVLVKRIFNESNVPVKVILYMNENFVREYGRLSSLYLGVNDTYYVKDETGIVGEVLYNTSRNETKGTQVRKLYYHNDHKGSVAVITNTTGGIVEQTFYEPFGKILTGGGKTRYTYENQEYDYRIETYDFHFRQYNPEIGKFTQPDNLIQNVYDPQSLNRYAFERNNPYYYIDPDGHIAAAFVLTGLLGGVVDLGMYLLSTPREEWNVNAGMTHFLTGVVDGAMPLAGWFKGLSASMKILTMFASGAAKNIMQTGVTQGFGSLGLTDFANAGVQGVIDAVTERMFLGVSRPGAYQTIRTVFSRGLSDKTQLTVLGQSVGIINSNAFYISYQMITQDNTQQTQEALGQKGGNSGGSSYSIYYDSSGNVVGGSFGSIGMSAGYAKKLASVTGATSTS